MVMCGRARVRAALIRGAGVVRFATELDALEATFTTPQELAELAQLQAKQQKILSSGRTIANSQPSAMDTSSAPPNQAMPVSSASVSLKKK